mgnify:CR=1 FL=1
MGHLYAYRTVRGRQRTDPRVRTIVFGTGLEFYQDISRVDYQIVWRAERRTKGKLDNKDLDITKEQFQENVIEVGATLYQNSTNLNFGKEYVNLRLTGVFPNFPEVETVKLSKGRFINEIDIRQCRKVIVLNTKTAEILFDKTHTEPIGQNVKTGGIIYQVVGLYKDQGDNSSSDAYIPFTTLQLIYNEGNKVNNIIFTTKNLKSIEDNKAFETQYRKVLGAHHRFDPTDESAIWIWNRFTNYLRNMGAMNMLRIAIWVIGIFTLLSGL